MVLYIISFIFGCYLLVCLGLYFFQEKVIFFPEVLPNDYLFRFEYPFEENYIKVEPGVKLHSLFFKVPNAKGCVLYHHGNSRNLSDWASNYSDFIKNGYDVLFYDYRGYGKSSGKVESEKQLIEDAGKVYQWLIDKYPSTKIVQYGRSLGSGIAAQLSCRYTPEALVLETPYYSILSLAEGSFKILPIQLILKYPFLTANYLSKLNCPVHLIHGTNDKLIKLDNSEKLKQKKPDSELNIIQGGSHNNLPGFNRYQEVLAKILKY